ncbi:MAG: hypothetical protein U0798_19245 [Gemmataceae bacterium]
MYRILEALAELGINPSQSTAVVQGYGNVGSVTCATNWPRMGSNHRHRRSRRGHS